MAHGDPRTRSLSAARPDRGERQRTPTDARGLARPADGERLRDAVDGQGDGRGTRAGPATDVAAAGRRGVAAAIPVRADGGR
eukprot:scaffold17822_cov70-Phaeocystis_antarctica.AAC.2